MKLFKIGDKVKLKNSISRKTGIVVKVYEKDRPILDKNGEIEYFTIKGQLKIKFQMSESKFYTSTYSAIELQKV